MTSSQASIFDNIPTGFFVGANWVTKTKEEGMKQSEDNASEDWKNRALSVIKSIAESKVEFSADDVEEELAKHPEKTHDLRALGAMMKKASKLGYCEPTDRFPPSRNPKNHSCPRRVWRSLLNLGV